MRRLTFAVFFIVITLAFSALALEVPPKPLGRVSDYTNTLSASEIRELEQILTQFEQETTNQIAVMLIPTLEGDNLEDYSIRLAEKWKIGQEGKDNGVILLIVKEARKIRIGVGYGLEGVLPDSRAGYIIRNTLAPHFRRNDFYGGIQEAIQVIIWAIGVEYRESDRASDKEPTWVWYLLRLGRFLLMFFGLIIFVLLGGRREFLKRRKKAIRLKKIDLLSAEVPEILSEPPDDTPPGVVAHLLDESHSARATIATLIDLANRGAISIEQKIKIPWPSEPNEVKKRIANFKQMAKEPGTNMQCISCGKCDVYHSYIEDGNHGDWCPHCKKSQERMRTQLEHIVKVVDSDSVSREVEQSIVRLSCEAGSLENMICKVFSTLGDLRLKFNKEAVEAELFLSTEGQMTEAGYKAAAKWQAFKRYLAQVEKSTKLKIQRARWGSYLPYAIVFKLEWNLLRTFSRVDSQIPAWFHPRLIQKGKATEGRSEFDPGRDFPNSYLGAMIDALDDIITSQPLPEPEYFSGLLGRFCFGGRSGGGFSGGGGGFGGGGASGGW
jgi:uncharacterized protein